MRGLPIPVEDINRARAARNWSVSELARLSRIGLATASRACAGKPVSLDTIERIAEAFRAHPANLHVRALLRGDVDGLYRGEAS
jgi:transcriptional regulator with XRE-family HTH domain